MKKNNPCFHITLFKGKYKVILKFYCPHNIFETNNNVYVKILDTSVKSQNISN